MKKQKPTKRQGYVVYRKSRRKWEARYFVYDSMAGVNRAKTKLFETVQEAEEYLDTMMYQMENPLYIKHNGIPFCEMMRCNLELKKNTNQINDATYARTLRTIDMIKKYPLGRSRIDEISPEELQAFMNDHKYLSNSTIDKLYQMLSTTFRIAINRGYIKRNPMMNVLKPKSEKLDKEIRALTVEEQRAFSNYLFNTKIGECKYKNVFLIQMYMGLRVGEVLALKRTDIDLNHKKMSVTKTITRAFTGKAIMGKTTKTYAGRRVLPIPDYLIPILIEQIIYSKQKFNEEKLLFKPEITSYTNAGTVNSSLKMILKKELGITGISTHSLRHTFGTRCIESGMNPVVVQKLMGHTDVAVTLNTYTSVFDKYKQEEIIKVNEYYAKENLIKDN